MKLSKIRKKLNYNYQEQEEQFYTEFGIKYKNFKLPNEPVEHARCLICSIDSESCFYFYGEDYLGYEEPEVCEYHRDILI